MTQQSYPFVYFQSKLAPGKVIDISQNKNSLGSVVLFDYHKSPNQHFQLVPCEQNGYYFLRSQLSGKVLTVHGHNDANGALLVQQANNNEKGQKFKIEQIAQNSKEYYLRTYWNKAIDITQGKAKNDTPLIQWQLHGQANQAWIIKYVDL